MSYHKAEVALYFAGAQEQELIQTEVKAPGFDDPIFGCRGHYGPSTVQSFRWGLEE